MAAMLSEDLDEPDETFEQAHAALVHTLGNLTLTGYNSATEQQPVRGQAAATGQKRPGDESGDRGMRAVGPAGNPASGRRSWLTGSPRRGLRLWPPPRRAQAWPGTSWPRPWPRFPPARGRPTAIWPRSSAATPCRSACGSPTTRHPTPTGSSRPTGRVSPGFRWLEPGRTDDPRDLLRAEGVTFDDHGRANPAQRIMVEELAQLAGVSTGESQEPVAASVEEQAAELAGQFG